MSLTILTDMSTAMINGMKRKGRYVPMRFAMTGVDKAGLCGMNKIASSTGMRVVAVEAP